MFLSALSSSLLDFSKQEDAEVSVEVAGDVGIDCKCGILSVVEQFVFDARYCCEDFFWTLFNGWFVCPSRNIM